ncbi:unnamed protein product [Parnassius apollo]|uniref:(apollo) hypothetical protein n=1 Tax=Parnassius apollo TaxID=110799 RepID=A0A8S3XWC6_PARAO|nr:unnamed protein product [Parnassius apollo]
MGLIYSTIAVISLCFNRLVTWGCCAIVLTGVMASMMLFVVYGITMGYHQAQNELVDFALKSREVKTGMRRNVDIDKEFTRSSEENRTSEGPSTDSILELYDTRPPSQPGEETTETPIILQDIERQTIDPESGEYVTEHTRKLIGRMRRSKNNNIGKDQFWRPLRKYA